MKQIVSSRLSHLPKQGYQLLLVVALCTVVCALSVLSFPPLAHAASKATVPAEHCQIVLGTLQPGESTSAVLSHQCVQGNQQLVAPQASALLMTWYMDIKYGGASTTIYGSSGPCDSSGYGISNVNSWVSQSWDNAISSFKVWNNCTYTRAYYNVNYGSSCQAYKGNTPWVGSFMNDQISSFWINSTSHSC